MRKTQLYDHFTCHTEMTDSQVHFKSTADTPSDIHQIDTNRKLQNMYQEPKESLKEEIQEEKEYLILQNQIRSKLSKSLNFDQLVKFSVELEERQNPIHNLFLWIIAIFYRTSDNFYDWMSFKQSCILEDQGKDLQNRIGFMNMVRMTKLEYERTKHLIVIRSGIEERNKKNKALLQFIGQLYDIVHIIIKTYEAGQKVLKIEEELMRREIEEEQQQIHE